MKKKKRADWDTKRWTRRESWGLFDLPVFNKKRIHPKDDPNWIKVSEGKYKRVWK